MRDCIRSFRLLGVACIGAAVLLVNLSALVQADCINPCQNKTYQYQECMHRPGPEADNPCWTTVCIIDVEVYPTCAQGSGSGTTPCTTKYDPKATACTQYANYPYSKKTTLPCGDVYQKYQKVPYTPMGPCDFAIQPSGRCFIGWFGYCDGDEYEPPSIILGNNVCG